MGEELIRKIGTKADLDAWVEAGSLTSNPSRRLE